MATRWNSPRDAAGTTSRGRPPRPPFSPHSRVPTRPAPPGAPPGPQGHRKPPTPPNTRQRSRDAHGRHAARQGHRRRLAPAPCRPSPAPFRGLRRQRYVGPRRRVHPRRPQGREVEKGGRQGTRHSRLHHDIRDAQLMAMPEWKRPSPASLFQPHTGRARPRPIGACRGTPLHLSRDPASLTGPGVPRHARPEGPHHKRRRLAAPRPPRPRGLAHRL